MIVYSFLIFVLVLVALFLVTAVLMQESKGDMGIGGAGRQTLFGGSGGQSGFEKATWGLGIVFMSLALLIVIHKKYYRSSTLDSRYNQAAPAKTK
jgi:protein translocase SecG subunit